MKTKVDYEGLEKFLRSLTKEQFKEQILEANLRNDIDFQPFQIDVSKLNPDSIIEYGMPFLVDLVGNDISVCVLTRRRLRASYHRLVQCKLKKTIIDDCLKQYGDYLNGCWVIPKEFTK